MQQSTVRFLFYIIFGFFTALCGWGLSQIAVDFLQLVRLDNFIPAYVVLLTTLTPSIAAGMVSAETYLSNPTHYKHNWGVLSRGILKTVIIWGTFIGLILSAINWLLIGSGFSSPFVRIISWTLVGTFTGLAEGNIWAFRSVDGSQDRVRKRRQQSAVFCSIAGLLAGILFGVFGRFIGIYQEPIGMVLLGSFLGLALYRSTKPTHVYALRAGHGFYLNRPDGLTASVNSVKSREISISGNRDSDPQDKTIEEGLSIHLPQTGKLTIGSDQTADIFVPNLPQKAAEIWFERDGVKIKALASDAIKVGVGVNIQCLLEGKPQTIRHSDLITFYQQNNHEEFYNFVLYNRFLDPQA
jgi:hypothetical protein